MSDRRQSIRRPHARRAALASGAALLALAVATAAARAADEIVIGASLPLSGPLAGFGGFQQWGYKRAVDEANRAGGIAVDGHKLPVRLVIRDDKTDPNTTAGNIDTLISRDHAVALLGSCTPALVNAGALVAERHKMPMVTGCDPVEAFKGVRRWTTVWDLFFDEPELASAPFSLMKDLGLETNRKVAILHDNGPDGQAVGERIWPGLARAAGYEVVVNASFPTDATQFTSILAEAKDKGAEVVLLDAITPQAVSIRKQMASADFNPKLLVVEKGAEPAQFATALGKLADGVLVGGYWDPSFPYPGGGRPRHGLREGDRPRQLPARRRQLRGREGAARRHRGGGQDGPRRHRRGARQDGRDHRGGSDPLRRGPRRHPADRVGAVAGGQDRRGVAEGPGDGPRPVPAAAMSRRRGRAPGGDDARA